MSAKKNAVATTLSPWQAVKNELEDLSLSLLEVDCLVRILDQSQYTLDGDQQWAVTKALQAALAESREMVNDALIPTAIAEVRK